MTANATTEMQNKMWSVNQGGKLSSLMTGKGLLTVSQRQHQSSSPKSGQLTLQLQHQSTTSYRDHQIQKSRNLRRLT